MADDATPKKARLTDMLGHAGTERAGFGKLLPCRMCGGKPYAYDMRNTDTHQLCTVECDDHDWAHRAVQSLIRSALLAIASEMALLARRME